MLLNKVRRGVSYIWLISLFVQVIPDETPLDHFKVPIDSVERAAGLLFFDRLGYRQRRINTEQKAKVAASVWGAEFIQFLFLKEKDEFILFLKIVLGKIASLASS